MTLTTIGTLALLALVDATSFGTLLIPVWLLMAPGRVRAGRIAIYLSTVTAAYVGIGLALMFGATALFAAFGHLVETDGFRWAQLIAGVALLIVSLRMDSKQARARAATVAARGDSRISRWRARAMGDAASAGSVAALLGIALTAVLIEAASMLPYITGIAIIAAEGPGWPGDGLLLLGYCLVMIAPAVVLTVGRIVARSALEGPLSRLDAWLTRNARSSTAWIVGIVGFILAAQAANALWPPPLT